MTRKIKNFSQVPENLVFADIVQAMAIGWRLFRSSTLASLAYSAVAVCIGLILFTAVTKVGLTPMSLPLAGGFMLMAPAMLGGFFHNASILQDGGKVELSTPFSGFFRAPAALWIIALFCTFIFLIWLTDAGVLYSFTLGGSDSETGWLWFPTANRSVFGFWFWGSLMGSFLAFVIFCVSAFSVPLLFEGRATLIPAVNASVRTVFANFLVCMAWALVLSLLTVFSVLLLPLLLVLLPVLAYASYHLYQRVFPVQD